MVGHEEGGVRTKKIIVSTIALFVLATLIVVPISQTTIAYQFGIDGGKTVLGVGETLADDDENALHLFTDGTVYGASLKVVNSSGSTQSGAVSPTSITFSGDTDRALTINAPSTAGDYTLVVDFELVWDGDKVTRTYPIKVVEPIVLTVEIKNTSASKISDLSLQFVIDGIVMDATDETKDINIDPDSTQSVSYKWITDNVSNGKHVYYVQLHEDSTPIATVTGLGQEYEFYVGQTSYTTIVWIMVILTIVLIFVLLWVVRKPVKNYGKPKGRR